MSGTLKIGGKTLATHDTSSNKLAFHSDANDTGQLCRAWVNFDGTLAMTVGSSYGPDAPPADYSSPNPIRAAYNVDYIIDRGSGDYEIHFENAMTDANYCVTALTNGNNNTSRGFNVISLDKKNDSSGTDPSASSVRINSYINSSSSYNAALEDSPNIMVAIFR